MATLKNYLGRISARDSATMLSLAGVWEGADVCATRVLRAPDLTITAVDKETGEDRPYLFRWHLSKRSTQANDYLHLQVDSDPERPLHDHPWDNMTVILSANGYDELVQCEPPYGPVDTVRRRHGEVVFRKAQLAHRLILPPSVPYVLTRFFTGPKVQPWGFWIGDQWWDYQACTRDIGGGRSVFTYPPGTEPKGV